MAFRYVVHSTMIRTFRHRGIRRLYERGDSSRVRADQVERIALALADLDAADKPSDLGLPGLSVASAAGWSAGLLEYYDFCQLADHFSV